MINQDIMTELEELRFYVAVSTDNAGKSINEVCKLLETHLSKNAILRISDELSNSDIYADGKRAKRVSFLINPYTVDTIKWWHWYAGNNSN